MSTTAKGPQQLIEETQGLVKSLAWKISRGLPRSIDIEDLIAYGQVGLAEAARDFDPQRGGQFSTFAYYRIRGAIYDGISKMAWFRRQRPRAQRYEQAANELLGVEQGDASPAASGSSDSFHWLKRVAGSLAVVYLLTQDADDGDPDNGQVADHRDEAPCAVAAQNETSQLLQRLIAQLPAESAALIQATYFEGCSLQDAGRKLGISKAWASRLHARALQTLARSLRRECFEY